MEIYPAIDLKDGRCVRLVQGAFETVHTVADDPVEVARQYKKAGADVIHIVDLDGARDGKRKNTALVRALVSAASPVRIELGGGLRTMNDLAEADSLGVWRFILGSAALEDFEFVQQAVNKYGERIAVGVDAMDGQVKSHGWVRDTGQNELKFIEKMVQAGVRTIIYTDISTDGVLNGPSLTRLKAVHDILPRDICLVASGGVSCIDDIKDLRKLGVSAAIAGKSLYAGSLDLIEGLDQARYGEWFDKQDLVPAIIQHADTGTVLMLGYMNCTSLGMTVRSGRVTFWSRSREALWIKGETSGHFLDIREILADCDKDTLLLRCVPHGPVCHTGNETCFFHKIH